MNRNVDTTPLLPEPSAPLNSDSIDIKPLDTKFCYNCGKTVAPGIKNCPGCGKNLQIVDKH